MFQCRHCIYQGRGKSFQNCSWFWLGAPEKEKEELVRRQNSSGLRPKAAGLASPGGEQQPQGPAGTPSGPRMPAAAFSCLLRAEAGLGKRKEAGFRVLTPSQPPRFLLEDAKELGANEAGEEMRKYMEDADNTVSRVTLPLPVVAAAGWEGLTGRFWKGQWLRLPCAVLLTNTGYPGWTGKSMQDVHPTWVPPGSFKGSRGTLPSLF